jgi:uncharacterized repeat protein (TIGR03803 family)
LTTPNTDGEIFSTSLERDGNVGGLFIANDGMVYGTTPYGGTNGSGTIYRISQYGLGYQVLHSFGGADPSPAAPVIQCSDGMLYGTTDIGWLYKLNTDGTGFMDFFYTTNNVHSALLQGSDGALYGITYVGLLFRVNTDGTGYATLHSFINYTDGTEPEGTLVQAANGYLFGTCYAGGATNGGGTVFMINTNGLGFQVVHSFGDGSVINDQVQPASGLVLGPGGWLYGTTSGGTAASIGPGGVYQIAQDGGSYSQIYVFGPDLNTVEPMGLLVAGSSQDSSGVLFGTCSSLNRANGCVFALVINPPVSITPVTGISPAGISVFWPSWAAGFVL